MKKLISTVLIGMLAVSMLAGCGSTKSDSDKQKDVVEKNTETTNSNTTTTDSETTESDADTKETEEVTLNLADMSVYGIAIFNYADEIGLLDGYFDDIAGYDIKVNLSEWPSGVDQNTAFAAGEIDFSSMGNIPAVTGTANGYGTKILAVNYLYDDEYVLVVRDDANINSVEDLKGKNVGTYIGTVTHYAIAKYLQSAGLGLDDVNLLNVSAEAVTSLRNGDIDATVLGNVVAHQLEEEGGVHILSEQSVPIYNYVVGREEFAKQYPEIAERVLRLINDTWDYALEHQQEYIEFYANASGNEVATIQKTWEDNFPIKSAKSFSDEDYAAYKEFVDWMKEEEYINSDVDADSLLDLTYVENIEKQ